jgi:hypothetical protein
MLSHCLTNTVTLESFSTIFNSLIVMIYTPQGPAKHLAKVRMQFIFNAQGGVPLGRPIDLPFQRP